MGLGLVGKGHDRAVEQGDGDADRFSVSADQVLEETDSDGFAEAHGVVAVASPVDAAVESVAEANVVREFVELAVDRKDAGVAGAGAGVPSLELGRVGGGDELVQGEVAVEEEFEDGDAGPAYGAVAGRVCRMGG